MESALNVFYFAMAVYGWVLGLVPRPHTRPRAGCHESGDCRFSVHAWAIAIDSSWHERWISGYLLDTRYGRRSFHILIR